MNEDKNKNQTIRGYFGDELFQIKNRYLMDKGYSSEVVVKIVPGNLDKMEGESYDTMYREGIINSKVRNNKALRRVKRAIKKGRLPALVIVKNHSHIERLYRLMKKKLPEDISIDWVHHKRKDRKEVVRRFKEGELDVLIGTLILKRGKNFPLMRYMLNASGGKGIEHILQLLGRATRKHKSKKRTYYEDFYDEGLYLRRHSKRRIIGYKNEQLKVTELYK